MHDKLSTDKNLKIRGWNIPSIYSFCMNCTESTFHLFFDCSFALKLWSWLATMLVTTLQFTTIHDIWHLCDINWTPRCKVVIKACIINVLNVNWYRRNQARFQDNLLHWKSVVNLIISNVSLSSNNTKKTSAISMYEFTILKACKVDIHPPKVLCLHLFKVG